MVVQLNLNSFYIKHNWSFSMGKLRQMKINRLRFLTIIFCWFVIGFWVGAVYANPLEL